MKLIELYKEWMKSGYIENREGCAGDGGLCNALPIKYLNELKLFTPDNCDSYWASNMPIFSSTNRAAYHFNKLRQTIVLLICAMHDEL